MLSIFVLIASTLAGLPATPAAPDTSETRASASAASPMPVTPGRQEGGQGDTLAGAKCIDASVRQVSPASAQLRRLDELPPGRLELTVMRQIGGCAIPAVVREGIGVQADEAEGR